MVGTWVARREQAIAFTRAETMRKCRLIEEGKLSYRDGELLPVPEPTADVFAALHELNHQGDAKRLEQTILEAARQLSGIPDDQISDEPLSQTFFNRWRREAEMIDEDDLRQFWAKLLVEETKAPHSISPRTLDVARNLSRDEAKLFEKMAKDVFDGALVVDGNSVPPGFRYTDKTRLQDAGLIGSADSRREMQDAADREGGKPFVDIVFMDDGFLIRCFGAKITVYCNLLTSAGSELMSIFSVRRTQEDVVAIAKAIADQKTHSLISVHRITAVEQVGSGVFNYRHEDSPIWTTKNV